MASAENLKKFVGLLLNQVQAFENAIQDVLISRVMKYAFKAQLDMIGGLVGCARTSLDDEVYREAIQLQIYINNASGTPPEMTYIAQQISGATSVKYIEIGPGSYRLQLFGLGSVPAGLLKKVQDVSPDGVRLLGIHINYPLRRFKMGDRINQPLLLEE